MKWPIPRFLCWNSPFPLPKDTSQTLLAEAACENFGLLMERYLAFGDNRGQAELVREMADRRALVPDFSGQRELIEGFLARWDQTAADLGAMVFSARPQWRVIVGLGTNAVLQGGITLHPVHGFPLMPASALKGVSRVYAERIAEAPAEEIDRLFGKLDTESLCGDLLFFDGVPADVPEVERDVINPIFGDYYSHPASPPAAYFAPKPIFFLALGSRSLYRFGVASLSGSADAARTGLQYLRAALNTIGVGAKTAAGYGYWTVD